MGKVKVKVIVDCSCAVVKSMERIVNRLSANPRSRYLVGDFNYSWSKLLGPTSLIRHFSILPPIGGSALTHLPALSY